jgi:hypothetical protein
VKAAAKADINAIQIMHIPSNTAFGDNTAISEST